MAVDPSISLQATNAMQANAQRPGLATQGPMETISQFATIQNQLNQNRLFQQTFAARKRAGEIMGSVDGDIDAAYELFRKDPLTAAFADELISSSRATQQVLTSIESTRQEMAKKPLEAFTKSLGAWVSNPTSGTWDSLLDAQLAGLDKPTQERVKRSASALKLTLLDDLPENPEAMTRTFLGRVNGLMLGANMSPEAMAGLMGTPHVEDIGGQKVFGVQSPAFAGGGFTPANELQKTLAPQVQNLGNRQQVIGGAAGMTQGNAMTGLQPTVVPNPAGGVQIMGGAAGTPQPAQTAAPQPLVQTLHGTPLNPNVPGPFDKLNRDVNGNPVLTSAQAEAAKKLAEQYAGEETQRFQGAQETQRAMDTIMAQLDALNAEGGFITPGQFGEQRLAVAKTLNGLVTALGFPPIVRADAVGTAEALVKESIKGAFAAVNQSFGFGREAQSIVENATKAVPGIDNTYLGGRLVAEELLAVADRAVDRFNFLTAWKDAHGGYLDGAEAEFNKQNPVSRYTDPVLERYGLTKSEGWLPADKLAQRIAGDTDHWLQMFPDIRALAQFIDKDLIDRPRGLAIANALKPYWPQ